MPEENFQSSSFIPKGVAHYQNSKPSSDNKGKGGSGGGFGASSSLVFTISAVLAVVAALLAAAAFFYTQYLEADLADKQQQIAQAQAAFEPDVIDELGAIDTRFSAVEDLIENHTAVTPIFEVLESVTLASVQLLDVSFFSVERTTFPEAEEGAGDEEEDSDAGDITISITGVAPDYASVALQSQALKGNEVVIDPQLTDFALDEAGRVQFTAEFTLPAEFMSYEDTL